MAEEGKGEGKRGRVRRGKGDDRQEKGRLIDRERKGNERGEERVLQGERRHQAREKEESN